MYYRNQWVWAAAINRGFYFIFSKSAAATIYISPRNLFRYETYKAWKCPTPWLLIRRTQRRITRIDPRQGLPPCPCGFVSIYLIKSFVARKKSYTHETYISVILRIQIKHCKHIHISLFLLTFCLTVRK